MPSARIFDALLGPSLRLQIVTLKRRLAANLLVQALHRDSVEESEIIVQQDLLATDQPDASFD